MQLEVKNGPLLIYIYIFFFRIGIFSVYFTLEIVPTVVIRIKQPFPIVAASGGENTYLLCF